MSTSSTTPVTAQEEFHRENMYKNVKSVPFLTAVKPKSEWSWRTFFLSLFPMFAWLPHYNCKADAMSDLLTGFTVAVMHVPQGMAYAALASVNPIVGLYMAVFPTLPYIVMGTSKHISLGSFSITCIMAARPVTFFSGQGNTTDPHIDVSGRLYKFPATEVAAALCFSVGFIQVALGICKAGHLVVFLHRSIIAAFTNGAAVLVFLSQLPHVFGVKTIHHYGPFSATFDVLELFEALPGTNNVAVIMSLTVILLLMFCSDCIEPLLKLKFKIPAELFAVILGAWISHFFDLKTKYNIHVVGHIPAGIPSPKIPDYQLFMIPQFILESLSIAIICYAISVSMATTFATKDNYKIDSNQEFFAYGFGNMFGGFFPCLPMAASLSRSVIQYQCGGKTQLVTLFSAAFLILTMLFIGKYLNPLPYCVLAGIVIKNLKGMLLQIKHLPRIWKQSYTNGAVWIIVFLSVIILDMVLGLLIAFMLAVISIVIMNQKTYVCLLGQAPQGDRFLEMRRYQAAFPVPGILIVQIYAGLHFANINICINRIEHLLRKTSETDNISVLILMFSTVLFTDPEALDHLNIYINQLERRGIKVCLAECSGRVYEQMTRCKFFENHSEAILFPSLQNAVTLYKKSIRESVVINETSVETVDET